MTRIEHLDDKFDFGKFNGCTFMEVVQYSPSYLSWVVRNVNGKMCVFCDSVIEELEKLYTRCVVSQTFEIYRKQRLVELERYEEEIDEEYNSGNIEDIDCDIYERRFYGRYAGSYAQDEMGYSDDDIDTIFDGDPLAYWNID